MPFTFHRFAALMKITALLSLTALILLPAGAHADPALFLNAFGETATAYINDSFLLLGSTADGFVAGIRQEDIALKIADDVRKRVRIIRAKLKAVLKTRIAAEDKRLIERLDGAYACMDHLAWALNQYVREKSPDAANRFEEQRKTCLKRLDAVAKFYSALPPPEFREPLSTR
jgi:hypothetical protein